MHETLFVKPEPHADSLLDRVYEIAEDVARRYASEVDETSRFPSETIAALKENIVFSAGVPKSLGGAGLDSQVLADICTLLGRSCAASGMILAMHYSQVACLVNHSLENSQIVSYLLRLVAEQRLIASATSEVGTNGNLRKSICALKPCEENQYTLYKQATTLSYGEQADDLMVTVRRNEDSVESDQVLVLATSDDYTLEQTSDWNTMGMRGTCSPGANIQATVCEWQILDTPFQQIATQSMIPVSHIMWSAVWLGIAQDALKNARKIVQKQARKQPSAVPPSAMQLAAADAKLQLMESDLKIVIQKYEQLLKSKKGIGSFNVGFSLQLNNLKLNASRLVQEIVKEAIEICGVSAYRNDSDFSLSRHLRDAMSASLMVSNTRILDANASMHLVYKGQA